MICVKQAIIVEGRYDKIRLSNIVDTAIICTNGFSIYKDADKQELIKSLAEKTGIIILTDSDSAGFQIRSFIRSIVKKGEVLNAVTPDIFGKERRKLQPSKQGKLGVEGIPDELIIEALKNCGAVIDGEAHPHRPHGAGSNRWRELRRAPPGAAKAPGAAGAAFRKAAAGNG